MSGRPRDGIAHAPKQRDDGAAPIIPKVDAIPTEMIYENEILTLLFGFGTLIFVVSNFSRLRQLPHALLLLTGFAMLLPGWAATLFDQLFWGELFNTIEHVAYAGGVTMLALWTLWVAFPRNRKPL